jgi:hypothetical protein
MLALQNTPKRARSLIGAPPGYYDDRIDSWVCSAYFFLEDADEKYEFFTKGSSVVKDTPTERMLDSIRERRDRKRSSRWFGDGL